MQDDSDYYNPNPWARILGRANKTDVEIDGIISKSLIHSGAMISMMSKDYCYEHGYKIQPLEHLVPIEDSGRASVPYLEYVEVKICIPGINSFDRDVLILVSSTSNQYHQRVPIQVGSHVIDQVTSCISEEELQSLSQSWKVAYVSTIISKATSAGDLEFNLDHVRGRVVTSEEVTIPVSQTVVVVTIPISQTVVVKGLTMITGHHKYVHMFMESSPKCVSVFILGNTSELKPGKSEVEVVIQNRSEKDMKLKPCTKVGTVITANIVPTTQVSNEFDMGEQERVSCILAQVESTDILWETSYWSRDSKDILQKLNLSGMEEWEPQLQQDAQDLLCKFACIFSQNDLDLGKTSIIKHPIKVNDPVPFKEWYRCIPPGMYDEVKVHIQKMLDVGSIRPSNSPWASAVILTHKKDGKL